MPGWEAPTTGVRRMAELPAAARHYIERIEELVGARVSFVGVGPERDALIVRE
jgi:adenylosuccinate synthase